MTPDSRRTDMRQNTETYEAKRRAQGFVRVSFWIPAGRVEQLKNYARELTARDEKKRAKEAKKPKCS